MTTIAQVRENLASVLQQRTGVRADGYVGMTQLAIPCFRVARGEFDPRYNYSSTKVVVPFTAIAFAGISADRAGEKLLDTLADNAGARSVRVAVESTANWPITIDHASLTRIGETQQVEVGGQSYLAVEFDIEVTFPTA